MTSPYNLQIVPIMRAGPVLLEKAASSLPSSETYHVTQLREDIGMQVTLSHTHKRHLYTTLEILSRLNYQTVTTE